MRMDRGRDTSVSALQEAWQSDQTSSDKGDHHEEAGASQPQCMPVKLPARWESGV